MFIQAMLALLLQIGPVVTSASYIEWDYGAHTIEEEFRIYLSPTPNVAIGGTPTATVPTGTLRWAIDAPPGQWYAVVTAYDANNDIESLASNEVSFFVFPGPTNARVTTP